MKKDSHGALERQTVEKLVGVTILKTDEAELGMVGKITVECGKERRKQWSSWQRQV